MKKTQSVLTLAAALALGASAASAGTTTADFTSTPSSKGLGSFTGTMSYNDAAGKLTLTLNNTSAGKGKITAFAFDIAGDSSARLETIKKDPWKDERNKKGIVTAKPFGNYEAGAGIGGKFGATGIGHGIAIGTSRTFIFDLTGANAANLTAADFLSGPTNQQLVASFAGFKHGKTDRVGGLMVASTAGSTGSNSTGTGGNPPVFLPPVINPILPVTDPPFTGDPGGKGGGNVAAVPLPSAASSGLATLGLLGLIAAGRKMRIRAKC